MIATNEAVDILRHGWQDAASTLAEDVPEVAELLQARLEMAITEHRLDERHLLDTIQEVESVTSRAGSPSGQDLARRLRRTVYEYLLALDAARPLESIKAPVDPPAHVAGSPMVGAEEVAALGHAAMSRGPADRPAAGITELTATALEDNSNVGDSLDPEAGDAAEDPSGDVPAARRRFGLRRRQRTGADVPEAGANPPVAADVAEEPEAEPADAAAPELALDAAAPPTWQFSPAGEAAVFDGDLAEEATVGPALNDVEPAAAADPAPATVEVAAPADETAADAQSVAGPGFVAPRAGFHIVEDAPAHRAVDHDEPPLEMPVFAADELAAGETHEQPPEVVVPEATPAAQPEAATAGEPVPTAPADDGATASTPSDFLTWRHPTVPQGGASDAVAPARAPALPEVSDLAPAPADPHPAPIPIAALPTPVEPVPDEALDDEDSESRGWGVRRHGEAHTKRRGVPVVAAPTVEDDPFENNTRLSDMRRRIEERLRRKRCDEAAALLQEIAQETGGRAVAELAMNAGDRCRALGKSNAALNCYLAAARSDPVYELPLSRLADICIDNQDTELAVSYLERIARIYRFREDDKAALRTYRRIATIAPYREDVLTLLMNAQRTGQLE